MTVLLSLNACQSVLIGPEGTESASIGPALKVECEQPTDVPKQPTVQQMTDLWIEDRINLGDCRRRHKALAGAATILEGQFEADR